MEAAPWCAPPLPAEGNTKSHQEARILKNAPSFAIPRGTTPAGHPTITAAAQKLAAPPCSPLLTASPAWRSAPQIKAVSTTAAAMSRIKIAFSRLISFHALSSREVTICIIIPHRPLGYKGISAGISLENPRFGWTRGRGAIIIKCTSFYVRGVLFMAKYFGTDGFRGEANCGAHRGSRLCHR